MDPKPDANAPAASAPAEHAAYPRLSPEEMAPPPPPVVPPAGANPYVLSASVLNRAVLHGSGGLVVAHGGLSFTATAVVVTPEFSGGLWHRWGVLGVGQVF